MYAQSVLEANKPQTPIANRDSIIHKIIILSVILFCVKPDQ